MNILKKILKAIGCKQSTLCKFGYHTLAWYSKADCEMYFIQKRKFGPLVECGCCRKILHIEEVNVDEVEYLHGLYPIN